MKVSVTVRPGEKIEEAMSRALGARVAVERGLWWFVDSRDIETHHMPQVQTNLAKFEVEL